MFRKEIKYLKLQANLDMSGSAELHTCQMWFSINRPTPATDDSRQLPDPKLIDSPVVQVSVEAFEAEGRERSVDPREKTTCSFWGKFETKGPNLEYVRLYLIPSVRPTVVLETMFF